MKLHQWTSGEYLQLTASDVESIVGVLEFIVSAAIKYDLSLITLHNELQQIGLPKGMSSWWFCVFDWYWEYLISEADVARAISKTIHSLSEADKSCITLRHRIQLPPLKSIQWQWTGKRLHLLFESTPEMTMVCQSSPQNFQKLVKGKSWESEQKDNIK